MKQDDRFRRGDAAIRERLRESASRHGTVYERIELTPDCVYLLRGSSHSIAFRAKDIRSAADPEIFSRRIAPRLEAMFEELWWRQAVILMAGGKTENLRRS